MPDASYESVTDALATVDALGWVELSPPSAPMRRCGGRGTAEIRSLCMTLWTILVLPQLTVDKHGLLCG